jgi:DNA-binding transcriptional LysR family regulator
MVLDYARRFEHLQGDLENAMAELRDKSAGRLTIGANESSTLYLLDHIERYRAKFPRIKVQVRRSQSSKIPSQLVDGELELALLTYDPEDERLVSQVIYTDHLSFIVSPKHKLNGRDQVTIKELAGETFIAHNVVSPYRAVVIREFQRHKVPLNTDVEMPTIESIRKMVERNEGVAFLPRMCVEQEIRHGLLKEIKVKQLVVERKIRLVYPARRVLSHAAQAFLEVVGSGS